MPSRKPPDTRPTGKTAAVSRVSVSEPAGLMVTAAERIQLYAARRFIGSDVERKLKIRIPFDVYFQDPMVAARNSRLGFDEDCFVPWEPGLADGPTSARFAVVDYDAHTNRLTPPVRWDAKLDGFVDADGKLLDRRNAEPLQFHQVNVWAIVQRALDFFESGFGLGRRISWGFEGNRLIVVPHAGPGENAFYDRNSKSLQFYYFDRGAERIYTCLSTDIINHEFGHAVLDGIRPYYIEAVLPETAAFHEFMGDLTAILIALRNTPFRQQLIDETQGDLDKESTLSGIAEQFGKHIEDKPYLRSAINPLKMKDIADDQRPHYMSQVLTGAMFDIIIYLSQYYVRKRGRTVPQAFWDTIQRMQNMAIQPLDLLPPVDVTFRDYALAALRAEEIANPTDPDGYRAMMLDVFISRGILCVSDVTELSTPHQVFERLDLDVYHDIDAIASSPANAYRFLDDNRRKLFIPANADVTVTNLCTAQKLTRQARRLPRQILLQYLWREDVVLEGSQFGRFDGAATSLLCGGTLAFDQNGEMLGWARKPGSNPTGDSQKAADEQAKGTMRRRAFLEALARRVKLGRIGAPIQGEKGLLAKSIQPLTSRMVDGAVRFELSPHFGIRDDTDEVHGGRAWQISS
jgi:hypothetical protein